MQCWDFSTALHKLPTVGAHLEDNWKTWLTMGVFWLMLFETEQAQQILKDSQCSSSRARQDMVQKSPCANATQCCSIIVVCSMKNIICHAGVTFGFLLFWKSCPLKDNQCISFATVLIAKTPWHLIKKLWMQLRACVSSAKQGNAIVTVDAHIFSMCTSSGKVSAQTLSSWTFIQHAVFWQLLWSPLAICFSLHKQHSGSLVASVVPSQLALLNLW